MGSGQPAMLRSSARECEVQGHSFRANKRILLLSYNMLKDKKYYENPRVFKPDRIHPSTTKNLWFGSGDHFCLGFTMALNEIRSILSVILELPEPIHIVSRNIDRQAVLPADRNLTIAMASA